MTAISLPRNRRVALVATILAVVLTATPGSGHAAPAKFWINNSDTDPGDPGVMDVVAADGIGRRFHIWAQPPTQNAGDWNVTTNPFETFESISLDFVSPQSTFTIDSMAIDVANPTYSSALPRFEYVGDSSTGLTETDGSAPGTYDDLPVGFSKGVIDILGFRLVDANAEGFGPSIDGSDTAAGTTTSGQPAWLFASLTVTPSSDTGTVEFYMQVGRNGMNIDCASPCPIEIEFGVESTMPAPALYDSEFDRQLTLADDDADLVLNLAGAGDYNGDGMVNSSDYDVWRSQFGTNNYDADGNGNGIVDAADYTIWRDNEGVGVPLQLSPPHAVPEPCSAVLLAVLIVAFGQLYCCSKSSLANSVQ